MRVIIYFFIFALISCAPRINYLEILSPLSEKYKGEHAVVVFDSTKIEVNRDGSGKTVFHKMVKVFTTYGTKKYSEKTFWYITLYDTVIVKRARVIDTAGKYQDVPKENIVDMPMPAWEGSPFLVPNQRTVKITFPGVEKGYAVEYIVEYITRNAPIDSAFDYFDIFEDEDPILRKYLEINLPLDMELKWAVKNGELEYRKMERGKRVTHIWEAKDVPGIEKEPQMPPIYDVATKLMVSTLSSWKEVSKWYYNLCESKIKPDSTLIKKVEELTKDARSEDEKIRALYEFVNKEIRYVETKLVGKRGIRTRFMYIHF
jgi:hypothetical protein